MTTKAEIFANYNTEYGRHPHAMQVETKSGQSWMTVHNSYLDGLRGLHAVVEQWGFDAIENVTFTILPTPNSQDPTPTVGEGGTWSVEQVAAATRHSITDVQKLLTKPTGNPSVEVAANGEVDNHD